MKKLLILGASGLVGKALADEFKENYAVYGTSSSSELPMPEANQYRLQITELEKMKDIIDSIKPDAIISCLRGDFDQQLVFHKELALKIKDMESTLYYFSTANVFDGDFTQHHAESDPPNAASPYGKFKIQCEETLKEILNEHAVILRIPQVWGMESPRMDAVKIGISKSRLDVYSNLECNNLSDKLLAKQLRYILENKLNGIFHLGTIDMMTHQQFIETLAKSLTSKEIIFSTRLFQQSPEVCYFGLKSFRNDIPARLKKTNMEISSDLTV